jgi:phosphoribosylanthranilate isomerase
MKIKVCGITSIEQFRQLDSIDIDYVGFIFYKASSRYVADKIDPTALNYTINRVSKVGVFVNENVDVILKTIAEYSLDFVQLHGNESPDICKEIRRHAKLIKAFRINDENEQNIAAITQPYAKCCDHFLFDAGSKNAFGGTGTQFNWNVLQQLNINKPFFLSGGIDPADVKKIKDFDHPDLYAVDINSRFEISPGFKDMKRVTQFSNNLKDQL